MSLNRQPALASLIRRPSVSRRRSHLRWRPAQFGRARPRIETVAHQAGTGMNPDLRLFATTFAAGFIFVSLLIA